MQIIVVPEGIRKGIPICFTHRHLALLVLVTLVLLPAIIGVVTYKGMKYYESRHGSPVLAAYRDELKQSRAEIRKAREEATRHLNALAFKLGGMQAQVLRLNALGSRLTRMAGLDGREFNFDTIPGVGGPEKTAALPAPPDILRNMELMTHELDRSQARLMAMESMMLDRKLVAAVTPNGWPVQGGWVSSHFGIRMDPFTGHQGVHEGVDIAARFGSPVFAMGEGVVTLASDKNGYGLTVEITHESGLMTRYGHLSEIVAKQGDKVTRGQVVAKVGSTGRSTGPHLHFEVLRQNQHTNPAAYLASPAWPIASAKKTAAQTP